MGYSIKNRIFGSDLPENIKAKVKLRQLFAHKSKPNQEQIKNITDQVGAELEDLGALTDFLDKDNLPSINHLSARTPFARMWTAVGVSTERYVKDLTEAEAEVWEETKFAKDGQNNYINLEKEEYRDGFLKPGLNGDGSFRLFQWTEIPNSKVIYNINTHGGSPTSDGTVNAGNIFDTIGPDGLKDTGLQWKHGDKNVELSPEGRFHITPTKLESSFNGFMRNPPGITSISSETDGPLGTIKRTTVNFVVYDFHEFQNIFLRFFLKPGSQVFLDYGWALNSINMYNPNSLINETNIEDKLFGDNGYVTTSHGDMETLVGHVVNYDASVRQDGGFNCSVEIVSKNTAILATAFDPALKQRVKYGLDVEALGYAASNILGDIDIYKKASRWTESVETEEQLRQTLEVAGSKFLGGLNTKLPGEGTPAGYLSLEHGVFYGGSFENNQKLFVNFGWFEDKFLNKEFGFSDSLKDLINTSEESVTKDEGELKAKFSSKYSYCTYSDKLAKATRFRDYYEKASVIYPAQWGKSITYNISNKMHPLSDDGAPERDEYSVGGDWYPFVENQMDKGFGKAYISDLHKKRIPLREIFISGDMIKDALDNSNSVGEFLKKVTDGIKEGTGGIIDLVLQSNSYAQNSLCFVDKNYLLKYETIQNKTSSMNEFLESLLTFKPFSPETIVKEYDMNFKMPEGGLGNMIAVQNASNLDNALSVTDDIDGFVKMEKMERSNYLENTADTFIEMMKESKADTIVHNIPSVGREAGRRFVASYKRETNQGFQFDSTDFIQSPHTVSNTMKMKYNDLKGTNISNTEDFKRTLNRQLNRAVGPQDLDGELVKASEKAEETVEDTKKSAADIARSKGETLVNNPFEYFMRDAVSTEALTRAPFIGIELTLKIYGMSGFVPGDLVRVDYLPKQYADNVFFQITKVQNQIDSGTWSTTLNTQMRVSPGEREPQELKHAVTKAYLRDNLNLTEMENWIHFFGNLTPLNLNSTPQIDHYNDAFMKAFPEQGSVSGLQYIDYAFDTYIVATMNDWEWLPTLKSRSEKTEATIYEQITKRRIDYESTESDKLGLDNSSIDDDWVNVFVAQNDNPPKIDDVIAPGEIGFQWVDYGNILVGGLGEETFEWLFRSGTTCAYNQWCQLKKGDKVTIFTSGKYWLLWPSHMVDSEALYVINVIFKYTEGRVYADNEQFEVAEDNGSSGGSGGSGGKKPAYIKQVSTASPGGLVVTEHEVKGLDGKIHIKKHYQYTTAIDNLAVSYDVIDFSHPEAKRLLGLADDYGTLTMNDLIQKKIDALNQVNEDGTLKDETIVDGNGTPVLSTGGCGTGPACGPSFICDDTFGVCYNPIDCSIEGGGTLVNSGQCGNQDHDSGNENEDQNQSINDTQSNDNNNNFNPGNTNLDFKNINFDDVNFNLEDYIDLQNIPTPDPACDVCAECGAGWFDNCEESECNSTYCIFTDVTGPGNTCVKRDCCHNSTCDTDPS